MLAPTKELSDSVLASGLGLGSFFGFIFAIAGVVLMGTSIVSFCPIYKKLGMNSFRQ